MYKRTIHHGNYRSVETALTLADFPPSAYDQRTTEEIESAVYRGDTEHGWVTYDRMPEPLPICPVCDRRTGWNGHAYGPCKPV